MFVLAGRCLHAVTAFATFAADADLYDFDPTTGQKKSGKTPVKQENGRGIYRGGQVFGEGLYVVGADSRRAEIVWRF
jgi:hypothetical protein